MGMYVSPQTYKSVLKSLDLNNNLKAYEKISEEYSTQLARYYYEWILKTCAYPPYEQMEIASQNSPSASLDHWSPLDLTKRFPTPSTTESSQDEVLSGSTCINNGQSFLESSTDVPLDLSINSVEPVAKPEWHHETAGPANNLLTSPDTETSLQLPSLSEMSTHSRFHCKLCICSFASQRSYNRHQTLHKTKVYDCYMCGKTYKQARDYRAHVAAHKNGSIFKCDICTHVLSNSSDYLQHLKTHKQKDLHFCSHCKKYFRDACTLETHIRTHTGLKPYKCEECGKEFRQSGTYHRHKKTHRDI